MAILATSKEAACCDLSTLVPSLYPASSLADLYQAPSILITESAKDPKGGSFVLYRIKFKDLGAKRRYSEFESLRNYLEHVYPTTLVPSIPDKHSLANYANLTARAREEQAIVETRKRMLQLFLNRVASHVRLGLNHVFHLFISSEKSWADVCSEENILCEKEPRPFPTTKKPRSSEPSFRQLEESSHSYADLLSKLIKSHKKLAKSHGDLMEESSSLGEILNGFSLEEKPLTLPLELTGQSFDSMAESLRLVVAADEAFNDYFKELLQDAQSIKALLKQRRGREARLEELTETLQCRRSQLTQLESKASATKSGTASMLTLLSQSISNLVDASSSEATTISTARLQEAIDKLSIDIEAAKADLAQFSAELKIELQSNHTRKLNDWKSLLLSFAQSQKEYHQKSLASWEAAYQELAAKGQPRL